MIIYDVSDNRHRTQLMKILREYGQRVQRSSFECLLTEKQYRELLVKINRLAWKEDLIRVYKIKGKTTVTSWGDMPEIKIDPFIFI